jgi:hypothetical protein
MVNALHEVGVKFSTPPLTLRSKPSGKYKRSDVVVSKVPGRVGVAALRWSVTDRSATPQMDA